MSLKDKHQNEVCLKAKQQYKSFNQGIGLFDHVHAEVQKSTTPRLPGRTATLVRVRGLSVPDFRTPSVPRKSTSGGKAACPFISLPTKN
jgi:hypothetical protein|tara:strand:- start:378 stop:644 length:267 start_codon:yes stop_codon:yes gene_type:complete